MKKSFFSTNVGGADRFIRVAVGVLALTSVPFNNSEYAWLGFFGIPLIITGMVGFCGLYTVLGIKTCPMSSGDAH